MREFVLALRAIWDAWAGGGPLVHRGDFYTHTLMTPAFTPPPIPHGPPRVFLAAVGPRMTEVAGEVADGLLAHPFLTERYLREVTLPALARGRARRNGPGGPGVPTGPGGPGVPTGTAGPGEPTGPAGERFEIGLSAFVALDDADVEAVRRQISFYGSTPAYRPVLELHGWEALQTDLNRLSKEGRWDDMVGLVDDEVVDAMCVVGSPREVATELLRRYGDVAQRIRFNRPGDVPPPDRFADLVDAVRAAG
jgi:probable F420-dependent oxidoreductase